jgi:putative lipoic acid-binding regulatory protein
MSDETLLEFPCDFPIKLMGKHTEEFALLVRALVEKHTGVLDDSAIAISLSKNDRFVSITITITAQSKQQLDSIYQDATDHPDVLMAL